MPVIKDEVCPPQVWSSSDALDTWLTGFSTPAYGRTSTR